MQRLAVNWGQWINLVFRQNTPTLYFRSPFMKIKLKACLALLFGAALLTSCDTCEKPTVTELTTEDTDWLVYVKPVPANGIPDTVRFVNQANVPVKYVRTQLQSFQVPGEGYSVSDKCVEKIDVEANAVIQDVRGQMPGLATYILRKPNELVVQLLVQQLGVHEIDEKNPTHQSIELGGQTYHQVFEVNVPGNDTDNAGKLKKLYFNKSHGFIRVEFYGGKYLQLQV